MFQSRLAFLLLVTPFAACDAAAETVDAASHSSVGACVQRGVAYFESIGSFPAL
jgi:hypothetical protein